jgi:hypothetical protein
MEPKRKPKSKLSKREADELERKQEIASLEETYIEGVSNIDYSKMKARQYSQLNLNQRKASRDHGLPELPLISHSEWLQKELAKLGETKPKKMPPGKVQDPEAVIVKYRQKFVEALKEFVPESIKELRKQVPAFQRLFGDRSEGDCFRIIKKLHTDLYIILADLDFPPDHKFNYEYKWGEMIPIFDLSRKQFLSEKKRQLVGTDFRADKFLRTVVEAFSGGAEQQRESILCDFFGLLTSIYSWADKYHLKKDWLVEYAFAIIFQFGQNENLLLEDLIIGQRNYNPRTLFLPFEFKTIGWWASGDSPEEYKVRVTKEFEEQLDEYIVEASSSLNLNKLTKGTGRPPEIERVRWLVCWNLASHRHLWEVISDLNDFEDFRLIDVTDSTRRESAAAKLSNAFSLLERYGLPVRPWEKKPKKLPQKTMA